MWLLLQDHQVVGTSELLGFLPKTVSKKSGSKIRKYPVGDTCADKNTLPMSEEWADRFEMKERQKKDLFQQRSSEHHLWTCPTLQEMDSSSWKPHQVSFLTPENRKLKLQFTQPHQHWTNISWSDGSGFTELQWFPRSPDLSLIQHHWDMVKQGIHTRSICSSCVMLTYRPEFLRNVPEPWWLFDTKTEGSSEDKGAPTWS